MQTLQQTVQWMMENGYLVQVKGLYKLTPKLNQTMKGQSVAGTTQPTPQLPKQVTQGLVVAAKITDWTAAFMQFIQEAQVPSRGQGKGRSTYDLNKYSEDGMKAFRKAIETEGVLYQLLVKSTMLYYKTRKEFPVTIARYMAEGIWRTDYHELVESVKEGKVSDHIQKNINDTTEYSHFKLG